MIVTTQRLVDGARLQLSLARNGKGGSAEPLTVVLGGGHGCVLQVSGPTLAIWIPLRGRVHVGSGESSLALQSGEMLVSDSDSAQQVMVRGSALWIAVLGTRAGWCRALAEEFTAPTPDSCLLPARHLANHQLKRAAVRVARTSTLNDPMRDLAIATLLEAVLDLQSEVVVQVAQCPGRTYAKRRSVFLRLQRVRDHMAACSNRELQIGQLARMANYSPCHFIRAFCAAYGETPHAYLVRERLQRARRLLRSSPLSITEIAAASGFPNRCAFARLFREHVGMTAGSFRRGRAMAESASLASASA